MQFAFARRSRRPDARRSSWQDGLKLSGGARPTAAGPEADLDFVAHGSRNPGEATQGEVGPGIVLDPGDIGCAHPGPGGKFSLADLLLSSEPGKLGPEPQRP